VRCIDRYCNSVRKKTEKLLKKMFGFSSVKVGFSEMKITREYLEFSARKKIDEFDMNDVKQNSYLYARYRTLNKILSIYLDLVSLDKFIIKELENEY